MALFPTMGYGTRTAILRTSGCGRSAINTMLIEFSRGWDLLAVLDAVTSLAKSDAVGYIQHQFGIFSHRLYMVCVNIPALFTALLAGMVIPNINRYSPISKIALDLSASAKKGFAAFPMRCSTSGHTFSGATSRAKYGTLVSVVENISAVFTGAICWWVAMRPTFFRAVVCGIGAVCLYFEKRSAYVADFCGLSVLHRTIIPHIIRFTPAYIALQRWSTTTRQTPKLIHD